MASIVAAVVSSTSLSLLFFLLGCACGWFGHQYRSTTQPKSTSCQPAPLYEDLHMQSTSISMPGEQEKAFELKENVAYGPVRVP